MSRPADRSGSDDHILKILDACAIATRRAEFDLLPDLLNQLEAALQHPRGRRNPEGLTRIRHRMEENRKLLRAAQSGVRAASRRIAEVTSAASGLGTYDQSGRREAAFAGGALERKA